MSYSWINRYVGLPYVPGGRDLSGVDCYGLVRLVQSEQFNRVMPDWLTDNLVLSANRELVEHVCRGEWTAKDAPDDGDFAVVYRSKAAHHIGLVFSGFVLHAERHPGSVFERLDRFMGRFGRVEFGAWQP